MLDSDRIRVGIEVGQDFVFRNPTAIDLISERDLSSLIIKLKNDVFAEVFQRNLRATPGTQTPHFVGPVLEFRIVRDTTLQRDRHKFGVPRRLTASAGIASFAMLNNFRCAAQSADFADACNVTAIPLDAKFKVLVGIKTRRIDGKFNHTSGYLFGRMKAA